MPAPARTGSSFIRSAASMSSRSEGLALASLVDVPQLRILEMAELSVAGRCGDADGTDRSEAHRRLPGDPRTIRCKASRDAPTCCGGSAEPSRPRRRFSASTTRRARAACSIIWPRSRRTDKIAAPDDPCRSAQTSRADLAVAADARRRRARRLLEASRPENRRRDHRPRAAAQAFAMAVLFADRAAAMGRHRGDRHRRPDGPRRIPQRRAVHRHRRADAARSRPPRSASTASIPNWWWNGAR